MLDAVRKVAYLVGRRHRVRWLFLIVLAGFVSVLEATGAALVFVLVGIVAGTDEAVSLPGLGDLDRFVPADGVDDIMVFAAVGIGLFFLVRGVMLVGQSYVQFRMAENAGARLSVRLLRGYFRAPYQFHLRRNSAELIRNAYDSVQIFVKELITPGIKVLSEGMVVLGILAVLLITSLQATLMAVAALGLLALLLVGVIHPRVKALGRTSQHFAKTSLQSIQESLGAWRDVKVLGRERFFEDEFAVTRAGLARARYLRSTAGEVPRVVIETGLILFIVALLGVTAATRGSVEDTLPVLGLFGYAALRIQPSLNRIFQSLNHVKFAGPALDDLYEDVRTAERLTAEGNEAAAVEPLPFTRDLRVEHVRFRYAEHDVWAVGGIDLTITRGESIGLVGPSGGGKSTLVDLLLGLLHPTEGRILVDGVDIRGRTAAWQRNIGMVPQTVYLLDATLRRNIALGVADEEIDETQIERAIRLAQLEAFVDELPDGLDTMVGERGVRLSGGQRQRVAIARALYRDPQVLLFDEGTSALDNVTEAELMQSLEKLKGSRTLILVAHRLSTVRSCDRVVVVNRGRVVDAGRYDELEERNADFQALVTGGAE